MRAEEMSKAGIAADADLDVRDDSAPPCETRRSIAAPAIAFFVKFVPETKYHSLEELEIQFQEQYN